MCVSGITLMGTPMRGWRRGRVTTLTGTPMRHIQPALAYALVRRAARPRMPAKGIYAAESLKLWHDTCTTCVM